MYLLDTNVVSELRKARAGKVDRHVAAWASGVPVASLFLSVVAVQELEMGVLLTERRDPAQGRLLRTWLEAHVLRTFAERILPMRWSRGAAPACPCLIRGRFATRSSPPRRSCTA